MLAGSIRFRFPATTTYSLHNFKLSKVHFALRRGHQAPVHQTRGIIVALCSWSLCVFRLRPPASRGPSFQLTGMYLRIVHGAHCHCSTHGHRMPPSYVPYHHSPLDSVLSQPLPSERPAAASFSSLRRREGNEPLLILLHTLGRLCSLSLSLSLRLRLRLSLSLALRLGDSLPAFPRTASGTHFAVRTAARSTCLFHLTERKGKRKEGRSVERGSRSRRAGEDFDDEHALQAEVVVIGDWEPRARCLLAMALSRRRFVGAGAPFSGGRGDLDSRITMARNVDLEPGPGGKRSREILHCPEICSAFLFISLSLLFP